MLVLFDFQMNDSQGTRIPSKKLIDINIFYSFVLVVWWHYRIQRRGYKRGAERMGTICADINSLATSSSIVSYSNIIYVCVYISVYFGENCEWVIRFCTE